MVIHKTILFLVVICLTKTTASHDPQTETQETTTLQVETDDPIVGRLLGKRQTATTSEDVDDSPTGGLIGLNNLLLQIVGGLFQTTLKSGVPMMAQAMERVTTNFFSVDKLKADLLLLRRTLNFVMRTASFLNRYLPVPTVHGGYDFSPYKYLKSKVTIYPIPQQQQQEPQENYPAEADTEANLGGAGGVVQTNDVQMTTTTTTTEPAATESESGGGLSGGLINQVTSSTTAAPLPEEENESGGDLQILTESNLSGGDVSPVTFPPSTPADVYGLPHRTTSPPTLLDVYGLPQRTTSPPPPLREFLHTKLFINGVPQEVVIRTDNFDHAVAPPRVGVRKDKSGLPSASTATRPFFQPPIFEKDARFGENEVIGDLEELQNDGGRRKGNLEKETYGSVAEIPLETDTFYDRHADRLTDSFGVPLVTSKRQ